jgi:hypothetical protein
MIKKRELKRQLKQILILCEDRATSEFIVLGKIKGIVYLIQKHMDNKGA